jgi:hypothetical protein
MREEAEQKKAQRLRNKTTLTAEKQAQRAEREAQKAAKTRER